MKTLLIEAEVSFCCDICGADHSEQSAPGGVRWRGNNVCPVCVLKLPREIKIRLPELLNDITDRAKPLELFRDFVMRMPRKQMVATGGDAEILALALRAYNAKGRQ